MKNPEVIIIESKKTAFASKCKITKDQRSGYMRAKGEEGIMLRKEREINDFAEIVDVLKRCDTIRIAMQGEDYPYVVPVSFGMQVIDDIVTLYFHGPHRGRKFELLQKQPKVCVEGDIFLKVEPTSYGITTRYESVIGFGTVEPTTGEEKVHGLRAITEHYGFPAYPLERCKGLAAASVYKITLTELTGKRNKSN